MKSIKKYSEVETCLTANTTGQRLDPMVFNQSEPCCLKMNGVIDVNFSAKIIFMRAIRGSTKSKNTKVSIHKRSQELIEQMLSQNSLHNAEEIVYMQLQRTPDLNTAYPATALRQLFPEVPVIGGIEHPISDWDQGIIRALIVVDIDRPQSGMKHVYLYETAQLKEWADKTC